MRAQVNRVGDAWEYLEKEILVGRSYTPPVVSSTIANPTASLIASPSVSQVVEPFRERGLKKEWLDWMKEQHKTQLDSLMQTLNDKIKVFEGKSSYITKLKRWDYSGVCRRAVNVPECGFEKDQKIMEERVKLLIKEFYSLKPVNSELKLD